MKNDEEGGLYGFSWVSIIGAVLLSVGLIGYMGLLPLSFYQSSMWMSGTVPDQVEAGDTFQAELSISSGSTDAGSWDVLLGGSVIAEGDIPSSEWEAKGYVFEYQEKIQITAPDTPGEYTLTVEATQGDDTWSGSRNGTFEVVTTPMYNMKRTVEPAQAEDYGCGISIYPTGGTYEAGTEVTIEAIPVGGYEFDHWGGYVEGTDAKKTITVPSEDFEIVAHFSNVPGEGFGPDPVIPDSAFIIVAVVGAVMLVTGFWIRI